ncbi:hypothetical protein FOBRF1_009444 [Fusarium oxysporum]
MSCHHAFQEVVDDLRWSYCSSSPSFFNSEVGLGHQVLKSVALQLHSEFLQQSALEAAQTQLCYLNCRLRFLP